jgi:NADP-dependent 3-hydroxy acid dehydrogenase YdfG
MIAVMMLEISRQGGSAMAGLRGKVAWVTGAGSGIGLAGAVELARAGTLVVLSGRRPGALDEAVSRIVGEGGIAEAAPLDVADGAAVERVAGAILGRHGQVDILVNSAGVNIPKRLWKELSRESWDQLIDINVSGTFYCIAAVLPSMRARKDGLVINISSWAGRFVSYLTGPAYTAGKHAVNAMTHSLNIEECINGIRACAICPGEVATPIMEKRPIPPKPEDLARMLQAEDLGRTIRFVAEMPPHVCINEILMSPTWNRSVLGGSDIARR